MKHSHWIGAAIAALSLAAALAQAAIVVTDKVADVRGTKHNLSAAVDGSTTPSGGKVPVRTVKAASETQVCVFCHTPHAAEAVSPGAPLWNRKLSAQTYTSYSSSSLEASAAELGSAPGGSAKLCLSCHDGTMGIDKVNVLNGVKNATIGMAGATNMPGSTSTGFTRNLATDLSNDHPISFTYDSTLANNDGELRVPDGSLVGNRVSGSAPPKMPLENNQMQCATCHDPHLRDKATGNGNAKFLRMNRFQVNQPLGGAFSPTNDIICLSCHDKGGTAWAYSAHANKSVATQKYKPSAAQLREFPSSLDTPVNSEPEVWQVACLNCHDTHTTKGARRLLREGTDKGTPPKPNLEQTCFQCHSNTTDSAVVYTADVAGAVPDIKSDFALARAMPITRADVADGLEAHDIGGTFNDGFAGAECGKGVGNCGKDMVESRARLGLASNDRRHAECTDCHNPHRVIKGQNGLPGALTAANTAEKAGTHKHDTATNFIHTNIISGVLRGTFGVEPVYTNNSFQVMPLNFTVKRGDPGINTSGAASQPYVTREYQICLKCHSNYGYADDNLYPNGATRPEMPTVASPLTARNSNGHANFTRYTNQAKEFQAPADHAKQVGSVSLGFDGGAGTSAAVTATNDNNHRSWHPVMAPTGRTSRPAGGFLQPWNNTGAVGNQTMMCSDCHGSNTAQGTAMPAGNTGTNEDGKPWGPHGSGNNFLLKGEYSTSSGEGAAGTTLCFKCHDASDYANSEAGSTGFRTNDSEGDGHKLHANRISTPMRCNWCHVAVPHGWKNRGLLVNLNDVGPEAGNATPKSESSPYTNGPYYRRAFLRIRSFPSGTQWTVGNCMGGTKDSMRNACSGPTN